jgi:hypothetical protein
MDIFFSVRYIHFRVSTVAARFENFIMVSYRITLGAGIAQSV